MRQIKLAVVARRAVANVIDEYNCAWKTGDNLKRASRTRALNLGTGLRGLSPCLLATCFDRHGKAKSDNQKGEVAN
jgi:hypothetical protein